MSVTTRKGDRFPPWAYTTFSNATLEAIIHRGSPRQRIFACCVRDSWGYDSEFVIKPHTHAEKKRLASTQVDIAYRVGMSETHFNNVYLSLKEDGWFLENEDGLIRPNPAPPKEGSIEEEHQPPHKVYPELPSPEAFRALQDPKLASDWQDALEKWSEVRRRATAIDKAYNAMVDEFVRARTVDNDSAEMYTVQPTEGIVQPEKGRRTVEKPAAVLITDSTHHTTVESVGRSSVEKTRKDRPADAPPAPSQNDTDAERAAIAKVLIDEWGKHLNDAPSPKLVADVHAALAGAPPSNLRTKLIAKLKTPAKVTSMGLALDLARDVGAAWSASAANREAEQAKAPRGVAGSGMTLARARALLAESESTPAELRAAREMLRFVGEAAEGADA